MPEPVRIALRLLGLLLLVVGIASLVAHFWPGPARVAEAMGVSCANARHGSSHRCSALDAADVLWTGVWMSLVAGVVLRLITRPRGKGPLTIDLGRFGRP